VSISRKNQAPVGITNASGQPEIVLELDGLVLSMKPPSTADDADESEAETAGDLADE
jgi:hypothetical protein